jgi:hypothetical protein
VSRHTPRAVLVTPPLLFLLISTRNVQVPSGRVRLCSHTPHCQSRRLRSLPVDGQQHTQQRAQRR